MAETKQEKKTFKWGDNEYLLDDLLKIHAEQENNYYNFARDRGKYDEEALKGLRQAVTNRINAVKSGQAFEGDGVLQGDQVDNTKIQTQKKGLFKKDKYVEQDNTEWAKYYLNKLVGQLKPHQKDADKGTWDVNKHGLGAYLTGQGLNAQDIFEKYDLQDPNDTTAARSYTQRRELLKKHLPGYKTWLASKGFDFTKNENEWDDNFGADLDKFVTDYDSLDIKDVTAALRKFGAGDDYTAAFTSDRWDMSKPASQSTKEAQDIAAKKKKEEDEKKKNEYVKGAQDIFLDAYTPEKGYYLSNYIDYSNHDFGEGVTPSFMKYYTDLNEKERSKYGTYLGSDSAKWDQAYQGLMNSFKTGTEYTDANKGIVLQRYFEDAPNGFTDVGDGNYLINDSVNEMGQAYIYNPNSRYVQRVHISDYANQNANIKREYENLLYNYINKTHGTDYDTRTYVSFKEGGVIKAQLGTAILKAYNVDTPHAEEAKANGIDTDTQKAKNQYMDSDNQSEANPNAGWDAKHYARLGSAVADLGAAVTGFVPGWGTAASAVLGVGSTVTNFFTDMSDDAVTAGEMWKNLGLNLGMDVLGLIPGGGAASKMGKIVKTLKGTVPLIVALPGVASMLANSPEIAESWKKAFDGDSDEGGSKMDYQDYMNILQVLNVAAGAVNIGRNTYQAAKKAPVQTDKIAVDVTDSKGKRRALVLEGDDVEKFNTANAEGKAQEFINQIEGMNKYTINEITTSNKGKFWGRDQNDEWHFFNQNPFGQSSTGRARVLNLRNEALTTKWGKPITNKNGKQQTRLYAETGKWDADLGLNKGELVYTKKKTHLDDWKAQQQAAVEADFATWRAKAAKYKERTDKAIELRNRVDADIATHKTTKADVDAQIDAKQRIIDDSGAEATRIQDWLDAGGVKSAQNTIRNARAKIRRLEKSKAGKTPMQKKAINEKINQLEQDILTAKNELATNTPEAVLAAQDKVNTATTEQSALQTETARLQALLDNLNHRRSGLHTRATTHSAEYNSIKDFQPIKKKFNDVEYTFDVSADLRNLDNLFKQGGSINRNKINKFLNYAKG